MIEDAPKSFLEHLEEVRRRLLRVAVAGFAALGVVLMVPSFEDSAAIRVFRWLARGLLPPGTRLVFLDAFEPAWVILKVGLALSGALLSPYLLYQLFAFAAPAFARRSRSALALALAAGAGLFALGMLFAYAVILPASLKVLLGIGAAAGGVMQLTFDRFYSFVLTMLLVFGVPFELPLVLGLLVRLKVVDLRRLRAARKSVYVGLLVLSALITPDPTPVSQLLLAAALAVLYEAGLLACLFFEEAAPQAAPGRSVA